jgi:dienelactone hydrolase
MTRATILRPALTCLLATASALPAAAQEADPIRDRLERSPRHHEFVRIDTEAGRSVRALVVYPEVRAMEAAGKDFESEVYEGAGHGFVRSGEMPGASEADRQGREQAWERLKELLGKL